VLAIQTYSLLVVGAFLIAGYLIVRLPLLSRAYLPGSLVAGTLLLALSPQIAGAYFPDWQLNQQFYEFWRLLPKQLINIVFASLFLARPLFPFKKMWKMAGPQVAFGQMLAWGQYALGGLVTMLILIPFFKARDITAALIEISFEGGHGTVSGMAPVFKNLGFQDGQEIALGLATLSLCTALVSGVILVNWGRRRGYIKAVYKRNLRERIYHRRIVHELNKKGIKLREHLTPKWIVSHIILIAMSVVFGWLIYQGLLMVEAFTWGRHDVTALRYVPLFPFCMFGGMVAQVIWSKIGFQTSRPLIELLSSIALSVLIATAVATMSINTIGNNIGIFLVLAATGVLWIMFGFIVLARRMFKKNWFQNGIVNAAQSMGMTATGLLFLHMVDPEDKTSSAESFGFKQLMFEPFVGGGIVTALSMPAIIAIGLPLFTAIAAGICAFWMIIGLIYFGRK
jgi:ESS family glutamate:Na+ symporter